jgi:Na+/H+ antiporter NhaA
MTAVAARRPTLAGLSWAAAVVATVVTFAVGVLAVLGRDVSLFLLLQSLAFAWMG